jgi:hypothetical protein
MTLAQRIAQVFGWAFIIVGLAGFAATGSSMEANHLLAPKLFGIFPVNVLHNVVHLLFGIWGILAARSLGGARGYFVGAGVIYLLLAALGTVVPNGFGHVPIGGSDVGLHLFLALGLLASSFIARRRADPAPAVRVDPTGRR